MAISPWCEFAELVPGETRNFASPRILQVPDE